MTSRRLIYCSRGFFSSITAHVAPASIPPSATSSKISSGVPIGVIILVVVTGNFLHEHHDPAPQGDIINSHERSHQPQAV